MTYRHDIDGLRAVSVVAVFLFHISKNIFVGGFVGVDVFFVISGYLITLVLYKDLLSGTFSFGSFYMRRLRRIQPVMWTVALAVFLAGLLLLSPDDLRFLADSLRSVLSFTTNIFFANHSDYFNPDSEQYPILHFWSLAVEEQFYLFWPLLLFLLFKFKCGARSIIGFLLLIIAGSTLGAEWALRHAGFAKAAYFLLPFRMGELAMGGLLGVLCNSDWSPEKLSGSQKNWIAALGLFMLLLSFAWFSNRTLFPGLASLLPCGGAFLILAAGPEAFVNRKLLSWKPLVFTGTISYSLYLWHFPILAFLRYVGMLNPWTSIFAVGLAFALATWSKWKVEDRFRYLKLSVGQALWRFQLKPGMLVLVVVVATYDSGGLKQRYYFSRGNITEDLDMYYADYCHQNLLSDCRIGDKSAPTRALLIGDSHANHFMPFWNKLGLSKNFSLEARSGNSCAPVLQETPGDEAYCKEQKRWFVENYARYSVIFLGARWEHFFMDSDPPLPVKELQLALNETLQTLLEHHIRVIVTPQVPSIEGKDYEMALRQKYFFLGLFADSSDREIPVRFRTSADEANQKLLDFVKPFPGVEVFDPVASCPEVRQHWPYRKNGMAYKDDNHLTRKGAEELADCFLRKSLPIPLEAPPGQAQ